MRDTVEKIFFDALSLQGEDRSDFLTRATDGDVSLREEIESLLRAHAAGGAGFLDPESHRASVALRSLVPPLSPGMKRHGSRIGPYRIEQLLGSGGMGEVYRARRSDGREPRAVALKLLRFERLRPDWIRRFQLEQDLLTRLDHPNITRMIDAGTSADGIPFLILELVDGIALDRYCDEGLIPLRERIRIFRRVCGAVHAAHRLHVVHRDLKPNNVLVTADGEPKLLDFGIAKDLDADPTDPERPVTTTSGMVALTPIYASPEQIRGEPVTLATDVYSLGVMLHELLTGRRRQPSPAPYAVDRDPDGHGRGPVLPSAAVLRSAREVPFARPAHRIEEVACRRGCSPRELKQELRGDLDRILLKSLDRSPSRRYRSALALAEDLDRHLQGLPVEARKILFFGPGSRRLRIPRSLAFVLAIVLPVAAWIGWCRINRQLDRDERQTRQEQVETAFTREQCRETRAFLDGLFDVVSPYQQHRRLGVRQFLGEAETRVREKESHFPAVTAEIRLTLARTYGRMWMWGPAVVHLRRAITIFESLPDDHREELAVARSLLGRALCFERDLAHPRSGLATEAQELQQRSLDTRREIFGLEHPLVAESLANLAYSYWACRAPQIRKAERLYQEASAMYRRLDATPSSDHARALLGQAAMYFACGRRALAAARIRNARSMYLKLKTTPDAYFVHANLLYTKVLEDEGRYPEAIEIIRECQTLTPDFAYFRRAWNQVRLAQINQKAGSLASASRCIHHALENRARALAENVPAHREEFLGLAESFRVEREYLLTPPGIESNPAPSYDALLTLSGALPTQAFAETISMVLTAASIACDQGRLDVSESVVRKCLQLIEQRETDILLEIKRPRVSHLLAAIESARDSRGG